MRSVVAIGLRKRKKRSRRREERFDGLTLTDVHPLHPRIDFGWLVTAGIRFVRRVVAGAGGAGGG